MYNIEEFHTAKKFGSDDLDSGDVTAAKTSEGENNTCGAIARALSLNGIRLRAPCLDPGCARRAVLSCNTNKQANTVPAIWHMHACALRLLARAFSVFARASPGLCVLHLIDMFNHSKFPKTRYLHSTLL